MTDFQEEKKHLERKIELVERSPRLTSAQKELALRQTREHLDMILKAIVMVAR